jgi:hypothetical protein
MSTSQTTSHLKLVYIVITLDGKQCQAYSALLEKEKVLR